MKIVSLQPQYIEIFNEEYENCFKQLTLPYGKKLEHNFLEQRIFNSQLYPFDFSKVILTSKNEICGFILANLRKNPAQIQSSEMYLQLFFINEKHRKQGYRKQVFKYLFDYAKNNGINKIITSLQWGGIFPGIPIQLIDFIKFYEQTGGEIKKGELFLELEMKSFLKKEIRSNDYDICFFKEKDKEKLLQYLKQNFGIGWQCEVMSKVDKTFEPFNGYGLSNVYQPNDVIVVTFENKICGFCIVQSETDHNMAFFGPIAISKEHRGNQLGGIILEKVVEYLQNLKKTKIGLWTNDVIYEKFYKTYGFVKTGETVHVEWNI
jgi:GNAT superfamily N-acetyltransferase